MSTKKTNKKVYLDYAATTPVDKAVVKAMLPYFNVKYGNSASIHTMGVDSNKAVLNSRDIFSEYLNCQSNEIYFTSSATESNNWALKGVAFANKGKGNRIIVSAIEHDCVLNSAKWLSKQGFDVVYAPVDKNGIINLIKLKKLITKNTILVSIMHSNNEIGTLEPIKEVGKLCKEKGVLFHTDAAQSVGKLPIDVNEMNVDLLTASSHKIYGPKGSALLYIRNGTNIEPLLHGGGHESGKRSSTVNVPAIVGFAKALEICVSEMKQESIRQSKLRDKTIKNILKKIPNSYLNGHAVERLPNNVNIRFDFIEGEALMMELDNHGIEVSTVSACSSPKLESSHVLLACGIEKKEAQGTIRISLGRYTTENEITYLLEVLPKVVKKLRAMSPMGLKNS
ncbi:MAG: cysteine desulfurase family protein [Patescibacteria group bacterium]|nr:cysteine desulfurase [Patescibacteria group bacterium]